MYLSCNAKLRNCADNIGDNYIIQLINFEGKFAIIQPNYNIIYLTSLSLKTWPRVTHFSKGC